ncbi:hypothetical protein [Lutispora saccharofermentans]|uniref:Uncharacterized protein n=1 Tax=Lutispora saccharofermentans TaxID=3024236 RepID=A0ABT1NDP1_9FIRM|nr:hypothetical protein [Lutispora saccharofermentans]MCQ1527971.1 hypothetical protein [Lutispora saccharofermentans]
MSIRSVDFQILIPKAPEIQKMRHVENENQRVNQHINIIEDSNKKTKELKQINKADKAYKARIDKDGKNGRSKSGDGNSEKEDKKDKRSKSPTGSRIDILI